MSLATRLSRLTPALTGKQRALLVIRAELEGREQDPEWRNMPREQRREYDYYIALLYASNSTLGTLLRSLAWIVTVLERDRDQYALLGAAATLIEETLEETPDDEAVRKWQKRQTVTIPQFMRGLEHDVKREGLERLLIVWQELRALEQAWQEVAEACDGEELRHPDLIAQVKDTKARLLKLLEAGSPKHAKKPPEPRQDVLQSVRDHVDEAMRLFGYREPV